MEIKYLKSSEISKEVMNGLVEVFFSNRYEYEPNLYHRLNVSEEEEKKDYILKEKIRTDLEQRVKIRFGFFVVYDGNQIVGYNNHYLNEHNGNYKKLEIGTTVINPTHHGRGIGQEIYKKIEEMHREDFKIKEILRATWSTNERQKYLYDKNGYKIIEVIKNHYGVEGIHKLTFSKKVNQTEE